MRGKATTLTIIIMLTAIGCTATEAAEPDETPQLSGADLAACSIAEGESYDAIVAMGRANASSSASRQDIYTINKTYRTALDTAIGKAESPDLIGHLRDVRQNFAAAEQLVGGSLDDTAAFRQAWNDTKIAVIGLGRIETWCNKAGATIRLQPTK